MAIIIQILLLVFGLGIILKSADYFVNGASSLGIKLGMSAFMVGLTIIAIGTSAPEVFINAIAAYSGATDLSIGNIFGSNIAGILLGLGIAGIITPLKIKGKTIWREIPFSLLGAVIVVIFGMDKFINGAEINVLTRSEGFTLLFFFIIFIIYTLGLSNKDDKKKDDSIKKYTWLKSILLIVGGSIGLILGGNLVVKSATFIASTMGISQNLIGLTIVAAGTSLPEIITTIVAAKKKQIDLAVGGIVGTIIFNIFFALGITATIAPLPFSQDNLSDAFFLMFISILLFGYMFIGKKKKISKGKGVIFVLLYIAYIAYAVIREING